MSDAEVRSLRLQLNYVENAAAELEAYQLHLLQLLSDALPVLNDVQLYLKVTSNKWNGVGSHPMCIDSDIQELINRIRNETKPK